MEKEKVLRDLAWKGRMKCNVDEYSKGNCGVTGGEGIIKDWSEMILGFAKLLGIYILETYFY